jgi:hypothetical protein
LALTLKGTQGLRWRRHGCAAQDAVSLLKADHRQVVDDEAQRDARGRERLNICQQT